MASRRSSSTSSFDSCGSGSSNASIGSFDVVNDESRPARAAETNVLMEALLNFTRQRSVLGQPATRDATDDVTTFSTPTNERFTPISAPLSARGVRDNTKTFDDAQAAAEAFLNQHPLQTHSELLEQFERIVDSPDSDDEKAKESPVDDTANAAPDAAPTEVSDAQGDVEGLPDETSQLEELLDRFIEWVDAEDDAADEPDCFGDDDEANCKTGTGKSALYLTRVNRIKQQQTSFLCKWVGLKTTTWELEDDLVEWGFGTWVESYNKEHPVTNKKQSPAREHGPRKSGDELLNDLTSDNRKCHAVDFDAMFPMMAEYILEEMTGCGLHPLRFARVDRQHLNANFAWEWRQALDNGDGVAPVRVFHGTRRENVASILRRGLLVPGQGNQLKHRATPKHGTGIYASFDPSFADCFCNPVIGEPTAPKLMFVCAGLMRRDMSTFADGHITVFARSTLILPVYLVEYTTRAGIDAHRPVRVSSRLLLTDEFARHRTAPWDAMAPEAARFTNAPGRTFGPSQASAWYTDPRAARAWEQNVHVESKRPAKATKPDGSWAPAPRAGTVEVGSGVRVKAEYVYTGVSRRSLKQMPKAIRDAFRNGEVKQAERGRDKKAFQRRRDRN